MIGINSQILSENNGKLGIGFAIPIDARDVADQIISTGKVEHTWLGIEGTELTPDVAKALNLNCSSGVIVGQVVEPAPRLPRPASRAAPPGHDRRPEPRRRAAT